MLKQYKLIVTTRTQIWHCKKFRPLLFGTFIKQLQQATVRLAMPVRSCQQTTRHPLGRFSWNFMFRIF